MDAEKPVRQVNCFFTLTSVEANMAEEYSASAKVYPTKELGKLSIL